MVHRQKNIFTIPGVVAFPIDLSRGAFSSKGRGELSHYTMTTTNEGPTTMKEEKEEE